MMKRDNFGFTLIEALIVASIVATVVAFSGALMISIVRDQRRDQFQARIMSVRDNMIVLLKDPDAWNATVAGNGGFALIPLTYGDFALYQEDGSLFQGFNSSIPTDGFTVDGDVCHTYVPITNPGPPPTPPGDPNCPIRLKFEWQQVAGTCAGNPDCKNTVNIRITGESNPGAAPRWMAINPDKFNMPLMTRSGESVTINKLTCSGAGEVVVGFNNNGDAICENALKVQEDALIALFGPPPPTSPAPATPTGPASPTGPLSPAGPLSPTGPLSPASPSTPAGPVPPAPSPTSPPPGPWTTSPAPPPPAKSPPAKSPPPK